MSRTGEAIQERPEGVNKEGYDRLESGTSGVRSRRGARGYHTSPVHARHSHASHHHHHYDSPPSIPGLFNSFLYHTHFDLSLVSTLHPFIDRLRWNID